MDKEQQYATIVAENKDRIYRMCCCYVRDQDARKDAYQQVLIHIWQNLDSFEGRSLITTWIYRITVNTCLTLLKSERRRLEKFPRTADFSGDPSGGVIEPRQVDEIADEQEEDLRLLYACINELPPLDKTLVSLYLEDSSTEDMAKVLGISAANVRVKLHRIKGRLREAMERKGYGPR